MYNYYYKGGVVRDVHVCYVCMYVYMYVRPPRD